MMVETRVNVEGRSLALRSWASLRLTAAEGAELVIRLLDGVESDVQVQTGEERVDITLNTSAQVEVPAGVPVRVREASGNLHVSELSNALTLDAVRGNLTLAEVDAAVRVGKVHGGLRATGIGSLQVTDTVYGNLKVRECATLDVEDVRGGVKLQGVFHSVRLGTLAGNLRAHEIGGAVEASEVKGNATLSDVGETVRIPTVGGNLTAHGVAGELEVSHVKGNVKLNDMRGAVRIGQIRGNLAARELASGLDVEAVSGNAALAGPWAPGHLYRVSVSGNAAVKVEPDASAQFRVKSSGHLASSVSLAPDEAEPGWQVGTMGDGEATIEIQARGSLALGQDDRAAGTSMTMGLGMTGEAIQDMMDRLQTKLESVDWEEMERTLEESSMMAAMAGLQAKLEGINWDEAGRRTEEAMSRAMQRMEIKLERARARAERARERAERARERAQRAQVRVGRVVEEAGLADLEVDIDADMGVEMDVGPVGATAEPYPAEMYEEERLAILRMVEDGKITPQEADMLLDALEGR
jgi:DUF4097 and DUF4098 domain-containing protein YvlB